MKADDLTGSTLVIWGLSIFKKARLYSLLVIEESGKITL
jgi:hypothetical protein